MANSLYDKGREGFLDGSFNWATSSIKVTMVSNGYTPSVANDSFYSSIPTGTTRVMESASLTSKTVTAGVANAANVTFASATGSVVTQLVIWYDTGTSTTSRLIALIDTATGLPVTPNGGNITIQWDTGANKIFKL